MAKPKAAPKAGKASPVVAAPVGADVPLPLSADLPIDSVFPSPLNPRRRMDEANLKDLADSIVANGVLQPILVRDAGELGPTYAGKYEIICGARRHAAASLAVADGRLSASFKLPARIRPCTDAELVVLAATENLAREDMHPLDEAEVFAALRGVLHDDKAVGRTLGVSERTVFRRLSLLRLAPELQAAVRLGELNLQQAAAFALGSVEEQRKHFKAMKRETWYRDPDRIRGAMLRERIPVDCALFDRELYTGELVEDEGTGRFYFADVDAFTGLQEAAIAGKVAALEATWPWVKRLGRNENAWQYVTIGKKDKDAGAIVIVHQDHRVEIRAGVLAPKIAKAREEAKAKAAKKRKGSAAAEEKETRYLTSAQVTAVKHAKTRAMRRGVADHATAAIALSVLGLMGANDEVRIGGDGVHRAEDRVAPAPFDLEAKRVLMAPIAAALKWRDPDDDMADDEEEEPGADGEDEIGYYNRSSAKQARIFRALLELEWEQLLALHSWLVAQRIGSWVGWRAELGDSALAIAIAEACGAHLHLPATWQPDEPYFNAYSRDALLGLALANGLGEGFNRLKKREMVERLVNQPPGFWTWEKFSELRFLGDEEMKAAMAGPAPVIAPTPAAEAAE